MRRFFGRPSFRTALRYAGTALALGLFVYLLSQQGWQEIVDSVRQIPTGRFVLVAALAFLSRLAVAGRWTSLLWLSGVDLPLGQILRITYAGLFASNFLPTSVGGDIVRLAGAVQLDSQRGRYATSIAVDRLIGLAGMAMLLPIGVAQVLAGPGVSIFGGSFVMGLSTPALAMAGQAAAPIRLLDRAKDGIQRTLDVIRLWLSSPRALLAALGWTWVNMILKFSSMWLLFDALGEPLGFWQIAGLWSFVYFISLFPVSINSWGLQEISAGLVFSTIGGAATASALTVALLIRTVEALASVPGVFALPGMLALRATQAAVGVDDTDE